MKVTPQDAAILEAHEQAVTRLTSMRRVLASSIPNYEFTTAGTRRPMRTSPRPFTKKRRKLPGKRTWGNKRPYIENALARAIAHEINTRGPADKVMQKYFKQSLKTRPIED